MMMNRLRFAPSPTGFLHLGGLRTALFNYLWAKTLNAKLILRIEDTDQSRFVPGATEQIIKHLTWAGIHFDEGPHKGGNFGPYIQSQRTALYSHQAEVLLQKKAAYRCFCSADRLEKVRKSLQNKGSVHNYDRKCLHLSDSEIDLLLQTKTPYTIRLKVPEGSTRFEDKVYGKMEFQNNQIDDQILIKSDGLPTYHLANVVDDHFMKITHVMRGEEWISSTPKHLILYSLFNWEKPVFAHLPLLLNEDRTKLSKRQGNYANVSWYIEQGYLQDALINFVAFLGWNPKTSREVFNFDELVKEFSVESVNNSSAVVVKQKLNWFNKEHILKKSQTPEGLKILVDDLKQALTIELQKQGEDAFQLLGPFALSEDYLTRVIMASKERIHLINEIASSFSFFFTHINRNSPPYLAYLSKLNPATIQTVAKTTLKALGKIPQDEFNEKNVNARLKQSSKDISKSIPFKDFMLTLRFLISGSEVGPMLGSIISTLPRDIVFERLQFHFEMK